MAELIDLAALQDRLLGVFVDQNERRVRFVSGGGPVDLHAALDRALQREVKLPRGMAISFDHIHDLFPTSRSVLDTWKEGVEDLVELFSARDRREFEAAWQDLWNRDDWKRALDSVKQFGAHQALLAISFVTTLRHFGNGDGLADAIAERYQLYFFDPRGFRTVDGISVRQPVFPTLAPLDETELEKLRAFFGLQTAERYLRDLLRIAVEAAADLRYQLPARIDRIDTLQNLDAPKRELARSWLAGFSSMAEGLVMSSVEQMTQGISSFSANPLMAAAASTLAAIAARKATQHAFLWELGIETT